MGEQTSKGWRETVGRTLMAAMGVLSLATGSPVAAAGPQAKPPAARAQSADAAPDQILVRFKRGAGKAERGAAHAAARARSVRKFDVVDGLELVAVEPGSTVESAMAEYHSRSDVLYAEPNYRLQVDGVPNDPSFPQLWGMQNAADHDIDAPEAWNVATGSRNVVVMIIDTGIDYNHPDLRANVWSNPLDCDFDGVDDDGNGYADDCHGIDAVNRDSDPFDDHLHGTHVAGTIGAVGNNTLGVVGLNHAVSMMACKAFDAYGNSYGSEAITCLEYTAKMKDRGIDIVATNNSWGGGLYSQALVDAINGSAQRGILFINSAGNWGLNLDVTPVYPASYGLPNMIVVAATDSNDELAYFSNYGAHSVHVGAPGADILSTLPGGGYGYLDGTSMAAPHVTGLVALLKADHPGIDWATLRNLVLTTGEYTEGTLTRTTTGFRINASWAVLANTPGIPTGLTPGSATPDGSVVVGSSPTTLRWNAVATADRYEIISFHWDWSAGVWVYDGSRQSSTNSLALPLPVPDAHYAWAVRAGNARGWGDFSPFAFFYYRACTFSISPGSASFSKFGGSGFVNVSAPSGCAWTATSNKSWIGITSGSSGSGSGVVRYSVARNSTKLNRTGTLTIAGKTFTVTQGR